jgi:hypothetical protein
MAFTTGELRKAVKRARQEIGAQPLVVAKGSLSIHLLRRLKRNAKGDGDGWRELGYAVWSCVSQSWVFGGWDSPVTLQEAARYVSEASYYA